MKFLNLLFKKNSIAPKNINMEGFEYAMSQSNETEQALICYEYLKMIHDYNFINKILHKISNLSMNNNQFFALKFIELNGHLILIKKLYTLKHKWLGYSALWNLFRFQENREKLEINFVKNILNDYDKIYFNKENSLLSKVQNTFFGALSNFSLNNRVKPIITLWISNLTKFPIYNQEIFQSITGLLCNLCVDDNNLDLLLNFHTRKKLEKMKFVEFIFQKIELNYTYENLDDENNTTLIRNTLAMINNMLSYEKFHYLFIKYHFIEKFKLVKNKINNLQTTLWDNITEQLDFDFNSNSIHKAIKYDYKDLVYKWIKEKKFDINYFDNLGNTNLHIALENNNLEIARFLILNGANVNISNADNKTPMDYDKNFIDTTLKYKKKLNDIYLKNINKEFRKNLKGDKYEINLSNIINSYIDKIEDTRVLSDFIF